MTTKDFIMTNSKLEFVPVSKWNEYFTYPSVGAIRQYIFIILMVLMIMFYEILVNDFI